MITVVGLGFTAEDLTLGGLKVIQKAKNIYARTGNTKAGKALLQLKPETKTFDDLYESAEDFDQLNAMIKQVLVENQDCVFCVDGAGGDDPVVKLLSVDCQLNIVNGVSTSSQACAIYPNSSVEVKSATEVISRQFMFASSSTLVIKEISDKFMASELKLKLLDAYGEVECIFVRSGKPKTMDLVDLDREKRYDYSCYVILPQKGFMERQKFNVSDLYEIIYALVAPNGCPWDKVQTHKTIRDCCIEEAYELVEAINLQDIDKMVEETGDVLLQAFFHANIAERTGEYTANDVVSGVCNKLIHRHLHIFAGEKADTPEEALAVWEKAKAQEKAQKTFAEKMEQVAITLPALTRAGKIQKISEKMGFTQDSLQYWLDNIQEELDEFLQSKTEEEAGDLLYAVVRLIRSFGLDPELSLITTTRKMMDRFEKMEQIATERGQNIKDLPREEILALYDGVKNG